MPKPARHRRVLPGILALAGFTLIELLIVMSIIIVLAGLILATSGYVQKKGYRSRAEAEIAAMSAALESYKADNGIYLQDGSTTTLAANKHFNPDPNSNTRNTEYFAAGLSLYSGLSGNDAQQAAVTGAKSYMSFKPTMVGTYSSNPATAFVKDPFGNAYGYSTAHAAAASAADGYNPTFDLWSTAGTTSGSATDQAQWIKNW